MTFITSLLWIDTVISLFKTRVLFQMVLPLHVSAELLPSSKVFTRWYVWCVLSAGVVEAWPTRQVSHSSCLSNHRSRILLQVWESMEPSWSQFTCSGPVFLSPSRAWSSIRNCPQCRWLWPCSSPSLIWFSLLLWSVMADLFFLVVPFPLLSSFCPLLAFFLVFLSPCAKTPPGLPNVWLTAWSAWYLIRDVAFVIVFFLGLTQFFVWMHQCVDVISVHASLNRFYEFSSAIIPLLSIQLFGFFLALCCLPFFLTCLAPFSIAHCGFWLIFSASCIQICLYGACSCKVLTTDSMCIVGCVDVHRRYWPVYVSFP